MKTAQEAINESVNSKHRETNGQTNAKQKQSMGCLQHFSNFAVTIFNTGHKMQKYGFLSGGRICHCCAYVVLATQKARLQILLPPNTPSSDFRSQIERVASRASCSSLYGPACRSLSHEYNPNPQNCFLSRASRKTSRLAYLPLQLRCFLQNSNKDSTPTSN